MYIFLLAFLFVIYYVYQNKEVALFYLLRCYTLLQERYNKVTKYLQNGLRIEKMELYDDTINTMTKYYNCIKRHLALLKYMDERNVVYLHYTYNGNSFIDIITKNRIIHFENQDLLNYQPDVTLIRNRSYTNKLLSCSVSITNKEHYLYEEEDVTDIVLQLLHNSINKEILFRHIKIYILHYLQVHAHTTFTMNFIDDDCRITELHNENSHISMKRRRIDENLSNNVIEYSYDLRII